MQRTLLSLACASIFASCTTYSQQVDNNTDAIERIEVLGRAQLFYLDSSTKIGTKVEADLLDIPQSAQVINKQLIIDQAARDITDLYRSIAGVSEFSYSGVTFRGFRDSSNVFYDGVRGDPYSGFSVPQVFNVDRVEVLKGPAAALYGGGEPGGMINYVTLKPTFTDNREVKLTLGNYSTLGGSVDMSGGVSEDIAYRFGAFYESQDSFRNNADAKNVEVAGGLLFNLGDDTSLNATFDYIKQDLGGNRLRGVPVDDEGNFLVDRSYNANEKFDYQNLKAWVLQSQLEHQFSDVLQLNATVRWLKNEREQAYHESRSWVDANNDGKKNAADQVIRREYRNQYRDNDELSLTLDFVYEFNTAALEHQLLFGGDYHDVETDYDYFRARYEKDGVANLNIFTLNYGITDPSKYRLKDLKRDGIKRQRQSLYVQDIVNLSEQWILMLGARFDSFDETNKQSKNNYDDSDVSYRAGITYKPVDNTSIYVNYSESFNPVSPDQQAESRTVRELKPVTGNQIELGVKKEWLNGRILSTLAIYQIDKENLVIANPNYIEGENDATEPPLINFGLVESEGLELTLVGDIVESLSLTANYAYNETQIKEGRTRNTFGDDGRFVNAPKHQAGLWARYDLTRIDSSIAFGVDYVSEQFSFNGQRVKPYTVFDASWTTRWNDYLFSLNINNLFDKSYAVSGFSERNGHFPGDPREIIVQVSYQF